MKGARDLRNDAWWRWADELRGPPNIPHIEVLKENKHPFGATIHDVLTNGPAIKRAKAMLLEAIKHLGELQNADIPTIQRFIATNESELAKLDLSELSQWDDLPKSRVDELKEPASADGPVDMATLMPDFKLQIRPKPADPRVKALADRVGKLEKKHEQQ